MYYGPRYGARQRRRRRRLPPDCLLVRAAVWLQVMRERAAGAAQGTAVVLASVYLAAHAVATSTWFEAGLAVYLLLAYWWAS